MPLEKKLIRLIPRRIWLKYIDRKYKKLFCKDVLHDSRLAFLSGSYNFQFGFDAQYLDETAFMEFEGKEFMIPKRYDDVLKYHYGDYMTPPPPEKRCNSSQHTILKIDLKNEYKVN